MIFFFAAAFAITWGTLAPILVLPRDELLGMPWLLPLVVVGKFGPTIAGMLSAGVEAGRRGVGELLERLAPRRADVPWILFGLLFPPAAAAAATAWLLQDWPLGPHDASAVGLFPALLLQKAVLGGGLGEEIGWRGFALPRLQRAMHPLAATLVLGSLWAAWHWPAFHTPGSDHEGDSFVVFLGGVLSLAVVFTWVYNRSRGSLAACVVLHASVNACVETCQRAFPLLWINGPMDAMMTRALALAAAVIVVGTRGRLGARPEEG